MKKLEKNLDIRDEFFGVLLGIARCDKNVILLTADTGALGVTKFKEEFPDRYFNIGIAEQNMVNIAIGMTLAGKKVFCYCIASFLRRCYEQIYLVGNMNLPIVFIGMGPERDYGTDGYTHWFDDDKKVMGAIPNMHIEDADLPLNARNACYVAYTIKEPVYVRLRK